MPKCCVKKCRNNTLSMLKKDGVSYFRFPANGIDKEKWRLIIAHERGDEFFKPNASSVICSDHFLESDIYHTDKGYRKIRKHAFPKLGVENCNIPIKEEIPAEVYTTDPDPLESTSEGVKPILSHSIFDHLSRDTKMSSYFNGAETDYYKNKLFNCQGKLESRTKEVQNLKKKNKRLILKNIALKALVQSLKKNKVVDKSLMESLTANDSDN